MHILLQVISVYILLLILADLWDCIIRDTTCSIPSQLPGSVLHNTYPGSNAQGIAGMRAVGPATALRAPGTTGRPPPSQVGRMMTGVSVPEGNLVRSIIRSSIPYHSAVVPFVHRSVFIPGVYCTSALMPPPSPMTVVIST